MLCQFSFGQMNVLKPEKELNSSNEYQDLDDIKKNADKILNFHLIYMAKQGERFKEPIIKSILLKDFKFGFLYKLPSEILLCKNIQKLKANTYNFTTTNFDFSKLLYLQYLYLESDSIVYLSKPFLNAPNLKKVNLDGNMLSTLPGWFFEHKKLEDISLSDQITPLKLPIIKPNGVVKVLTIKKSNVNSIPLEFLNFTALEELNFSENKISTLPESIKRSLNLKLLNMSKNSLKDIPKAIKECKRLNIINLSSNQIEQLPEEISELDNLEAIDMSSNPLKGLPFSMSKLKKLREINLSNTTLDSIPAFIFRLPKINSIIIQKNPTFIKFIQRNTNFLDSLDKAKPYINIQY